MEDGLPLDGSHTADEDKITYFQKTFKIPSPFREQYFEISSLKVGGSWDEDYSINVPRYGDLLHECFLYITLNTTAQVSTESNSSLLTASTCIRLVDTMIGLAQKACRAFTADNFDMKAVCAWVVANSPSTEEYTRVLSLGTMNDVSFLRACESWRKSGVTYVTWYEQVEVFIQRLTTMSRPHVARMRASSMSTTRIRDWVDEIWLEFNNTRMCAFSGLCLEYLVESSGTRWYVDESMLIIPLPFWFCKHSISALPLYLLFNTTIDFHVRLHKPDDGMNRRVDVAQVSILTNYTLLSSAEKKNMMQRGTQQYLIESVEEMGKQACTSTLTNMDVTFRGLSKYMVYHFDDTDNSNVEGTLELLFASHPRLSKTSLQYLHLVQPFQYKMRHVPQFGMFVFCKHPMSPEPSGHCNMGVFPSIRVCVETKTLTTCTLFSVNQNYITIDCKHGLLRTENQRLGL